MLAVRGVFAAFPPYTARASQEFSLDGYTYDFSFILDGEHLRGDFRAHGVQDVFLGVLQGGRTEAARRRPKLDEQPCAVQCGARCLGTQAIADCREQCRGERAARPICSPPDTAVRLPLPHWGKTSGACPPGTDPWFYGLWVFLARDTEDQSAHRYELRLASEACAITVKSAQKDGTSWPIHGLGKVTGDRRWELHLEGEGRRHTWTLAGWDPVFGTFKTTPVDGAGVARGVLSAHRQP
jgi:hypothetical protein